MTNENRNNYLHHKPLTSEALSVLQKNGYKFLLIQGYTMDHHAEYVEPHYLMLVPIKEMPTDQGSMGIYEPIDSEIINSWIKNADSNDRLEVYLAGNKKKRA